MGITGKDVGDFQAGVGQVGSQIGVIMSYVGATLLILVAIGMAIFALTPTPPMGCNTDAERAAMAACVVLGQSCKQAQEALADKQALCAKKTRKYWFLLGVLLIPLAVFIVWYAKWWNNFTHTNRTAAQVGGGIAEVNIVENMLNQ